MRINPHIQTFIGCTSFLMFVGIVCSAIFTDKRDQDYNRNWWPMHEFRNGRADQGVRQYWRTNMKIQMDLRHEQI